jgi:hypothetical protein
MQHAMNERMMTIGIIMAVVCDHSSGKGTTNSQHDVPMAFCLTADTTNNCLITTPEMEELFGLGYSAIAVVRFDPKMPDKFSMFTSGVPSECLQSALSKKAEGLVHDALSRLARAYN